MTPPTHTHTHPANSLSYTTFTTMWQQEIPYYLLLGLKDMKKTKNLTVFFYCFIPHLCYMVARETVFVHVNKHDK